MNDTSGAPQGYNPDDDLEKLPLPSRWQRFLDFMTPRVVILQFLIILAMVISFWGREYWWADLFSHFYPQYLLASALTLAFALVIRLKALIFIALVSVAVAYTIIMHSLWLWPRDLPVQAEIPDAARSLTIAHANMLYKNEDFSGLARIIEEYQPDIINIQESSFELQIWLHNKYRDTYPYRIYDPQILSVATIVLSRTPIKNHQRYEVNENRAHHALHSFEVQGVRVLSVHTMSPLSEDKYEQRSMELFFAAEVIRRHKGLPALLNKGKGDGFKPILLVGDLNITPYSPLFRDIMRSTQQQFLGQGAFLHQPTWPEWMLFSAFQIHIDHMLYDPAHMAVKHWETQAIRGSDHLGIVAEFAILD